MNLRRILSPEEAEPFLVSVLEALKKPVRQPDPEPDSEREDRAIAEYLASIEKPKGKWR